MAKADTPGKILGRALVKGDWKTKVSFLITGFGQLARGQIVKGLG